MNSRGDIFLYLILFLGLIACAMVVYVIADSIEKGGICYDLGGQFFNGRCAVKGNFSIVECHGPYAVFIDGENFKDVVFSTRGTDCNSCGWNLYNATNGKYSFVKGHPYGFECEEI